MKNLDLLIPKERPQEDRFTWATVTQSQPVRIRLEGENAALDIEPDSLVDADWLDVGRRVWCHIHGRRVIVLGQAGKWRGLAIDTDWQTPTLLNGWTNYGANWETACYRRIENVVYIAGMLKPGTITMGTVIFNLPQGYWPRGDKHTMILASNDGNARLNIYADGRVCVNSLTATPEWVSIDNISFPTA